LGVKWNVTFGCLANHVSTSGLVSVDRYRGGHRRTRASGLASTCGDPPTRSTSRSLSRPTTADGAPTSSPRDRVIDAVLYRGPRQPTALALPRQVPATESSRSSTPAAGRSARPCAKPCSPNSASTARPQRQSSASPQPRGHVVDRSSRNENRVSESGSRLSTFGGPDVAVSEPGSRSSGACGAGRAARRRNRPTLPRSRR
jgi:hypothetical protein